jgi:hypothetical protein
LTDLRGPQLDQVIMNPQAFHRQIELAQRHIKQHYSFQSLGLKWQATLEQLNAGLTTHSTSTSQT